MSDARFVKVCGLSTAGAIEAAAEAGATHVGFIFYPPSPRSVSLETAGKLAPEVPEGVKKVAVFVDASDQDIADVVEALRPEVLQLHGKETPDRVRDVKARFGLPVMKAIRVSTAEDIEAAKSYAGIADCLLFDAKPPKDASGMLPGGNGLAFDWTLLTRFETDTPWFLSGGLDAENVSDALRISGATAVDVSSGVEDSPGVKNLAKITEFLTAVRP